MKKLFTLIAYFMAILVSSCSEYDDTEIWNKLSDHENRIVKLEELCRQMNTNITALQTIVNALQKNDYITNVAPVREDGKIIGYTITFAYSDTITIYHGENGQDGEDGKDGKDGADGQNGKDGYTPKIGVMKDSDGVYYWTVDGEWLLDDKGNKIKAEGNDGKNGENGSDGTNGSDGITPQLKIENNYWFVSYDNGKTWIQLYKATGEDGDNYFKEVYEQDGYMYFVLNDEQNTTLKISYLNEGAFVLVSEMEGDVKTKLSDKQKRTITHLIVEGVMDNSDIRYLADQMLALEILDLRKTTITKVPYGAFCKGNLKIGKETLRRVYLPITCKTIERYAFYGCVNLEYIEALGNVTFVDQSLLYCSDNITLYVGSSSFEGSSTSSHVIGTLCFCGTEIKSIRYADIDRVIIKNSVTTIGPDTDDYYGISINSVEFEEPSSIQSMKIGFLHVLNEVQIPTSIKKIDSGDTGPWWFIQKLIIPQYSHLEKWELDDYNLKRLEEVYCYRADPPTLKNIWNDKFNFTVYVPYEYYSVYATAPIWKDLTIKPIM